MKTRKEQQLAAKRLWNELENRFNVEIK